MRLTTLIVVHILTYSVHVHVHVHSNYGTCILYMCVYMNVCIFPDNIAANSAAFAALDESKVDVKDLFMHRYSVHVAQWQSTRLKSRVSWVSWYVVLHCVALFVVLYMLFMYMYLCMVCGSQVSVTEREEL